MYSLILVKGNFKIYILIKNNMGLKLHSIHKTEYYTAIKQIYIY